MKTKIDISKIKKMRLNGKTLKEIGNQVGRTSETIRLILKKEKVYSYCVKHSKYFVECCRACVTEKDYNSKIEKLSENNLLNEIKKLAKPDRQDYTVIKRAILIKKLYDEYHLNFPQIAKLLCRHHSSIINLYYKQI